MELKEAIEFIRLTRLESGLINERKDYDDITDMLEKGEKFEKMWGGFKTDCNLMPMIIQELIMLKMENFEHKYFPK